MPSQPWCINPTPGFKWLREAGLSTVRDTECFSMNDYDGLIDLSMRPDRLVGAVFRMPKLNGLDVMLELTTPCWTPKSWHL